VEQIISISSSLAGRDLALLKSMINIMGTEDSREQRRLALQYTDNEESGIHIYTDNSSSPSKHCYCAKIRGKSAKKIIGEEINPKVLRNFFASLFSSQDNSTQSTQTNNTSEFIETLYNAISASEASIIAIQTEEALMICDTANSQLFADHQVGDIALARSSATPATFSHYPSLTECFNSTGLNAAPRWKGSLSSVLWRLALRDHSFTLANHFNRGDFSFEQIVWPDYGSLPFNSKHVMMSSILGAQPTGYRNLIEQHGFSEEDVNAFINAGCLSGHIRVLTDAGASAQVIMKSKSDGFLSRLKHRFFG
jgi:hypothetical protein